MGVGVGGGMGSQVKNLEKWLSAGCVRSVGSVVGAE